MRESPTPRERFEALCAPTGRVFVVPHGVDHDVFRPEPRPRRRPTDDVALEPSASATPVRAVPRHARAAQGGARSRGGVRPASPPRHPELSLVLAGRPAWGADAVDDAVGRARSVAPDRAHRLRPRRRPCRRCCAGLRRSPTRPSRRGSAFRRSRRWRAGRPSSPRPARPWPRCRAGRPSWCRRDRCPELADALAAAVEDAAGPSRATSRMGLDVAAAHTWEASAGGPCGRVPVGSHRSR